MKPSMFMVAVMTVAAAKLAPAQDQATTLTTLAQQADVVVRASVTTASNPTPAWRQLVLRTDHVFKGSVSTSFALTEPEGQCCGRSLFALKPGDERILFLKRVGPTLHTIGGGRGILPTTAALLNHTQALLQAPTAKALGHLLVANLEHAEPRIAHDAAMALATLPNLSLTANERDTVAKSLALAVQRGSTKTAALADITARFGDTKTVDAVLPIYINARRQDQAALVRKALARCSPTLVAERMQIHVGTAPRASLRAAKLLTDLPANLGQAAMANLLSRPVHPQVKMRLCEGLLDAGVSKASLEPMVPEAVLKMAVSRRQKRPTFKNILPRR